jgi:hypothetical protein
MRRRARFLRKARELAYRDLGGLVFNLHRFGQRNDTLVMAKLSTLGHIDAELRALESTLEERQPVTVLREAGITACARCAAIHSSEDHFCPNCGLAMGRHADLPIAGAAATPAAVPTATPAPVSSAPASAPARQPAPGADPVAAPAPTTPARPSVPAGRSPAPPSATPPSAAPRRSAAQPSSDDEPTEIINPPSAGP